MQKMYNIVIDNTIGPRKLQHSTLLSSINQGLGISVCSLPAISLPFWLDS